MLALRVLILINRDGYTIEYGCIQYQQYDGLLGKLGLQKAVVTSELPIHPVFYFQSIDQVAEDIINRAIGYDEVHLLPTFNYSQNSSFEQKIKSKKPDIKFARTLRKLTLPLDEVLKSFYFVTNEMRGKRAPENRRKVKVVKTGGDVL